MRVRVSGGAKSVGVFLLTWIACLCASVAAFALPEGRVYEMVSPSYKGGYGVGALSAVAPSGESLAFLSLGEFASPLWDSGGSIEYVAHRGSAGWSTISVQPPPIGNTNDFSGDFEYTLGVALLAPKVDVHGPEEFLLHRTDMPETIDSWEVAGGIVLNEFNEEFALAEVGASRDLCHIVGNVIGSDALLPGALNTIGQLYDFVKGCDGEPSLRLVGLNNEDAVINPRCEVDLGVTGDYVAGPNPTVNEQDASFNPISANGRDIFFTTNVEKGINCSGGSHQLFVRLDGASTLEVSRPLEASKPFGGCGEEGEIPCPGAATRASAYFKGASEDGSRVFFTTRAQLVSKDKDEQNDLYTATIGCSEGKAECEAAQKQVTSLMQVSHDSTTNQAGDVQGVVRIAPDGRRIYFVARGALSKEANAEGQTPVTGADNLYVYDSVSGRLVFITDLCSGPSISGGSEDLRCPRSLEVGIHKKNDTGLWGFPTEAQSTADGEFLVFSSFGQLLGGDTDAARDIYRYDADSGVLERVSLGVAGYHANGNNSAFDAAIHFDGIEPGAFAAHELEGRALSEDGSRIVFASSEPLSPDVVNGLTNFYEWYKQEGASEGQVSLVSSGSSLTFDGEVAISPSGRDIFFTTTSQLVSQDVDDVRDIYDARLGGGFTEAPAPRQPCSGDACQGPLSVPAPLLVPGSVSQASGDNLSPPKKKMKATKKRRKASARKPKHRVKRVARVSHDGTTARGRR